jgi:subtilisin family serine protease
MTVTHSARKPTAAEYAAVVRQRVRLTLPCLDPRQPVRSRVTTLAGTGGTPVPIIDGRVLCGVRSSADRVRLHRLASALGLHDTGPLHGLDQIHAFAGAGDVGAAVTALRAAGVEAGPDHIMAVGGRDKWIPGPDPTVIGPPQAFGTDKWWGLEADGAGPVAHPGPAQTSLSAVRSPEDGHVPVVVMVDTGVTARGRTDGLLHGVRGDRTVTDLIDLDPAHGTFVAGLIRQVAPEASVHVVRAFGSDGVAPDSAVAAKVLEARRIIASAGGRGVINLSWGCRTFDGRPPLATARAVAAVCAEDIAVVAAAGNDGSPMPWFPAALPGVVAVGALELDAEALRGAVWSNFGAAVDVSVVGEGVISTFVGGSSIIHATGWTAPPAAWTGPSPWAMWSGTSFAAPQVAGRIAQLLVAHPDEPATVLVKRLADEPSARDVDGYGLALRIL